LELVPVQRASALLIEETLIRTEEDRKVLDKALSKWSAVLYGLVRQECGTALVYTTETPAH
jgi:hypothetical protein